MVRHLGSHAHGTAPTAGAVDELALLASMSEHNAVVPTAWLAQGESLTDSELAQALGPDPVLVLVRAQTTAEGAFAALVLAHASNDRELVRQVSSSCAEACYGVSTSRFASHLGPNAGADAIDATLVRLSTASGGALLPPPSLDRVRAVVELARARSKIDVVVIQPLPVSARFGSMVSRDPRTGSGPSRARLASSPQALLETKQPEHPLAELDVPPHERERLERALRQLEELGHRPVRAMFVVQDDRARLVGVHLLRRSGLAAFGIAHDLARAGALTRKQALALVQPADVAAALSMRLEVAESAVVATGIAAGSGIGEGFVCLEPLMALQLHAAGLPAILFVHDVLPEDIPALQSSAGVVAVRGGLTGEAAVIARGYSRPCVASGASLSLSGDVVRIAGGGVLKPGERITIDGATGLIARGAAALAIGELGPQVAALIGWLDAMPELGITALVDCPEHVLTAQRLGAHAVVVARPEVVLFDALNAGGDLEEALFRLARAIAEAAHGRFARLRVCALSGGWQSPLSGARQISAGDRLSLSRAWLACNSQLDLELVREEEIDEREARAWTPADRVVAARIARARD